MSIEIKDLWLGVGAVIVACFAIVKWQVMRLVGHVDDGRIHLPPENGVVKMEICEERMKRVDELKEAIEAQRAESRDDNQKIHARLDEVIRLLPK